MLRRGGLDLRDGIISANTEEMSYAEWERVDRGIPLRHFEHMYMRQRRLITDYV